MKSKFDTIVYPFIFSPTVEIYSSINVNVGGGYFEDYPYMENFGYTAAIGSVTAWADLVEAPTRGSTGFDNI